MKTKTKKKFGLNMRLTLLVFAIGPMLLASLILSIVLMQTSSKELKNSAHNSLLSVITEAGTAVDYATVQNKETLQSFVQSPIVIEFLKNPNDPALAKKAQEYTANYYSELGVWEGLYLSDWNSKVLTHNSEGAIGTVMREGDSLKNLQNAMLSKEGGVYNPGILKSPSSGQLVMPLYTVIYDENGNPLGYAGGGVFFNSMAATFSDVSALNLSSAYVYFVDAGGTMLYHPDETKIGNAVENAAVKGLVEKLAAGQTPKPECVEYLYKGTTKYAAYYIGEGNSYIAVLTADESDVLSSVTAMLNVTVILCIACVAIFTAISFYVSRKVSVPLGKIAEAIEVLSTGDVTVESDAKSGIKETISIINAFNNLKSALMTSMTNVKDSAVALNEAIINVDDKTAHNVESVSQINDAIDEVANTSQAVAQSAQTMNEKALELGNNIEVLNNNVTSLYESSQTIKSINDEATVCMKSVFEGANESVEAVENISQVISETNTAIEDIGRAVQTIESIATQTNLLSLNASIEAARAGEAGAGFAIVAEEIRSLADSSAESAKEIKQIIDNVMTLSNGTVKISNRVHEVISKEKSDIEAAQGKFTILSESVEASIREIDTIKQMATTLDGIKGELANATTDLGAISEELGASAEEVAASCTTVSAACTDTQASTEEMRAINENMSSAIEFFKLS